MIARRSIKTFEAKIFVGFRKAYSYDHNPANATKVVEEVCRNAVRTGWCLSIYPVKYIYTPTFTTGQEYPVDGEDGAEIHVINYPRYPADVEVLKERTISLAGQLMTALRQERVTIVFTDDTIMLEQVAVSTDKSGEK